MKLKLPGRKRALRWIALLIVLVLIGLYVVMPIGFAIAVVFPVKEKVGDPPAGFQELTLTTDDGVKLAAWYAPPTNGAAIILLHGAGGSRESMRSKAALLTEHGYGVLALDLRGHGESGGHVNRLGWQGTRDVGAAVAFLQSRDEVGVIGGFGSSMGGEVMLGAASTYPEIIAIVADGATRRSLDELRSLPSERPFVRNYVARVMYFTVGILSGDEPPDPPLLDSMVAAEATRFLLIAGGDNDLEVKFNELFAEKVGDRAELWIAPGVGHTRAWGRYPDEYAQRLLAFFDAQLLGEGES